MVCILFLFLTRFHVNVARSNGNPTAIQIFPPKINACVLGVANGTSKNVGLGKFLAGSRNLGSVFDKSRSLVFAWFVFNFFEPRNFLPKSLGLGFLTRISASRRVSDFTIRHPSYYAFASYVRHEGHLYEVFLVLAKTRLI